MWTDEARAASLATRRARMRAHVQFFVPKRAIAFDYVSYINKRKSLLAKATHKPSTKAVQDKGHAAASYVAKKLGVQPTPTHHRAPMDVIFLHGGSVHGVEVKSLQHNENQKLTMHPEAKARKIEWGKTHKAQLHTIAVDLQGSRKRVLYKAGVGSFRTGSMVLVPRGANLKKVLTAAARKGHK